MLYPANPYWREHQIFFCLKQVDESAYNYAFIDEGIAKIMAAQQDVNLDDIQLPAEPTSPQVLVFHLSHCGSSLLVQLLKKKAESAVWGEPELINTILLEQLLQQHTNDQLVMTRLQKAYTLLGLQRFNAIKLSSWNLFNVHLIKKAFPLALCIYIHRHPVEVLHSLLREPNGFATWNKHGAPLIASHLLELPVKSIHALTEHEYLARMLCLHMKHAVLLIASGAHVLMYPKWVNEFPQCLANVVKFDDAEMQVCFQQLKLDAKRGDITYQKRIINTPALNISTSVMNEMISLHHQITDIHLRNLPKKIRENPMHF